METAQKMIYMGSRMKAYRTKISVVLLGFILVIGVGNSQCGAASFRGLGFLQGGTCSEARGVSAKGMVVVGTSCTPSGVQAFRWTNDGGMKGVPVPTGLIKSWGVDVSADGNLILGQGRKSDGSPYGYEGFLWNYASGCMYHITAENRSIFVTGMTSDGSIVVGNEWTEGTEGKYTPYRWSPEGQVEYLNLLYDGEPATDVEAVSADGRVIVGSKLYDTYPFRRIIYWTEDEVLTFGAQTAIATSRNGAVVVGTVDNLQTQLFEAYRWSRDTGVILLGTCLPRHHSRAMDVSGDDLIIVGYVQSDSTDEQMAMMWDQKHGMRLLKDVLQNDLGLDLSGWKLTRALAISDDGSTIVGDGWNPENQTEAWRANITTAEGRVYFADANLKAAVEEELGISDPNTTDMLSLTHLDAGHIRIADITPLRYAKNLKYLNLEHNHISDISALAGLVKLRELDLDADQVSDITPLAGLKDLEKLDLKANRIRDIAAISAMTNLAGLDLKYNLISDISSLSGLLQLTELELQGNPLNTAGYCSVLPSIRANNPGIDLDVDPNPNPLTEDCITDPDDLLEFAYLWLETACDQNNDWCEGADMDHSGQVNMRDFAQLAGYWGN
jgi:probable HAF family extracellular repeat protein